MALSEGCLLPLEGRPGNHIVRAAPEPCGQCVGVSDTSPSLRVSSFIQQIFTEQLLYSKCYSRVQSCNNDQNILQRLNMLPSLVEFKIWRGTQILHNYKRIFALPGTRGPHFENCWTRIVKGKKEAYNPSSLKLKLFIGFKMDVM